MEPNIPVGSEAGVQAGMARALAGAEREQREGASGKWVAHWKMVHIVRPVWERVGQDNQLGRSFPPLGYTASDADALTTIEPAPLTVRGARDLLSVGLQYGNAFLQGMQAAALKPADFFGNDDVLYLMEDMATGEIRLSILWEWLHKRAALTAADDAVGVRAGDTFSSALFARLLAEEYAKLLAAGNRDVHDDSKGTTLPIARAIVARYVTEPIKLPWYIDLLNVTLGVCGSGGSNGAHRSPGHHVRARWHAADGERGLRGLRPQGLGLGAWGLGRAAVSGRPVAGPGSSASTAGPRASPGARRTRPPTCAGDRDPGPSR